MYGPEDWSLGQVVVDTPQYSPQKKWQSNGGVEPSSLSCTVRVPLRRNFRRKVKTHQLLLCRNLNHCRWWRQKLLWNRNQIQNRVTSERPKSRRNRFIREGRFQSVDRNHIRPVTKLKGEGFCPLFQNQIRTAVEWSQRRNKSILSHEHKLGSLQGWRKR